MPKEKELNKVIPKIYKRNAEDLGLFFWIKGQTAIVPTITIDQGILSYFRFIGVNVDEWDLCSARVQYARMQREFYDKSHEDSKKNR